MCAWGVRGEEGSRHTVVVMADVDELLLELQLDLFECLDALVLGGVGRVELDGLGGGLLFIPRQ